METFHTGRQTMCAHPSETALMTEKELKKLGRAELLEMLISQSEELKKCREQLEEAKARLEDRTIAIDKAGSIAEASLALSGIFDAAQLACMQYTENIRLLSERQETVSASLEAESRRRAAAMIREAEEKSAALLKSTEAACEEKRRKTQEEADAYWQNISTKLDAFYEAHAGLRELMAMVTPAGSGSKSHEE